MAAHSSTLAWKIPWTEEPSRVQSMRSLGVSATSLSRIGEGNDNPLQYSCLEDPRGRGAWWAAVYGVAVRLKRLSNSASWVSQVVLVNNLSANANETCGFSPCAGKIPWRRKWQPTSSLENPMDRGAWWANSPQGHKIYQLSPTQL